MPRTRSLAWSELKIGVMAVAALVLTALLVIAVGGASGFSWERYDIRTSFANVQGLKAGAIVRVAGVEVGKVTKVELAGTGVDVHLSIKKENQSRVTSDSLASIGAMSLLGEPLIDVSPSTTGKLTNDPRAYDDLQKALANLQDMTARINAGEGSIGQLLKDDKLAKSLNAMSANFEQVSGRLNRSDNTAGKLLTEKELYDKLNSTVNRLDELTKNLNEGKGTAGQLLHDTKLYDTMNSAATEMKSLISDIRKDPKKYLNVRVSIF